MPSLSHLSAHPTRPESCSGSDIYIYMSQVLWGILNWHDRAGETGREVGKKESEVTKQRGSEGQE